MLQNYKMSISYNNDNKQYASSNEKTGHYVISVDKSDSTLKFTLKPTVAMQNLKFILEYDYDFKDDTVVFPNGYQSWTDSREMNKSSVMPPLTVFAKYMEKFMHSSMYGDYNFTKYSKQPGFFHGVSYSYIRNGETFELIGSGNERSGYTIIYFDMKQNKIIIEKDLQGISLDQNDPAYEVMNLYYAKGEYDAVFDKYFAYLEVPKPRVKRKVGYTSWYNYYQNISQDIIKRDLEALSASDMDIDIFQIDDGYQTAVGDWLSIDPEKFPNGMKAPVEDIHAKGMLAGLWLAPLNAQKSSRIFHEHKDWMICDDKGDPIPAGANWGGFYTLDFYKEEVRNHLKKVFNIVLNEWGYDMVKLDFLYSACTTPYKNKTRGQIMCEAMDFIRECVGDKLILGCGVPLFPSFGKVDFCRTGCDVSLNWKRPTYFLKFHREDVSTENSIKNTIFRRHLDGRAFCNDPDVYLLRNSNIDLTLDQRALIAKINKIFGNLLFISDNIEDYDDNQMAIFKDTVSPCEKKVIDAKYVGVNLVKIVYSENGKVNELTFNIFNGTIEEGNL